MKAWELMEELFALSDADRDFHDTCDTCKAGDPDKEIRKLAVAMFPTVEVIQQAAAWGADMLLVHEPTYYNHHDHHSCEAVEMKKRALLESTGMTLYRYHDHPHGMKRDMIAEGEYEALGLEGEYCWGTDVFDLIHLTLANPMTPRELAKHMEEKLGICHIRICGAADTPCSRISSLFGAPGGLILDTLKKEETEILLCGETTEWSAAEYARDAAALGYKKALLIMGHIGSEREGSVYLEKLIASKHPELETRYFECGEVYTYTDA